MSITDMKLLFRGEQIAKTCLNFSVTNCSTTLLHKIFFSESYLAFSSFRRGLWGANKKS